jgi:DNA mismatch endonuclease (patch repair protein)
VRSPPPLNVIVRRNMRTMPTRDSSPELELRRILHGLGLRYRLHARLLPGTPDIVFPSAMVAVFVDGCFWHACPKHCVLPRNNRGWWRHKLLANRRRDLAKDRQLKAIGWLPIHVWEHEDMTAAGGRVARLVRAKRKTRQRA